MKALRHLLYSKLLLLPILSKLFAELIIDFIIGFPPIKKQYSKDVFDAVLVIVDRLIKQAKYIPARKNYTAIKLTNTIYNNIICSE